MVEAVGISPSSVGRIWADAGLKPHIVKGFKVSNDPMFEAKVTEIVGLYLDPPERAVVLCVDEKSQIQALERTQPGLPLKKGRAAISASLNSQSVFASGTVSAIPRPQNRIQLRRSQTIRSVACKLRPCRLCKMSIRNFRTTSSAGRPPLGLRGRPAASSRIGRKRSKSTVAFSVSSGSPPAEISAG